MHLLINKRRLRLHPTSSEREVYEAAAAKLAWPKQYAYLEWSEGRTVEVHDEHELRLACRLVSDALYCDAKEWAEDFRAYEAKVAAHMAEPDSDPEEAMRSDDDMTAEDFYMMGFRHEICN